MEIKGKVNWVGEVSTGSGKNGTWARQDFVLETGDKYPKKVFMSLWGEENINKYDLVSGMTITAFLEIESREYNGKWYTNVRAWKIQWDEQKRPDYPVKQEEQKWPETSSSADSDPGDLPF
jgi:hypothetical protein